MDDFDMTDNDWHVVESIVAMPPAVWNATEPVRRLPPRREALPGPARFVRKKPRVT
jgi:hypothetical protein